MHEVVQHEQGHCCDFCSDQPIVWCYTAEPFSNPLIGVTYDALWFACAACQFLIDSGDIKAVTDRTEEVAQRINGPGLNDPDACAFARYLIDGVHAEFLRRRIGPGVPIPSVAGTN